MTRDNFLAGDIIQMICQSEWQSIGTIFYVQQEANGDSKLGGLWRSQAICRFWWRDLSKAGLRG